MAGAEDGESRERGTEVEQTEVPEESQEDRQAQALLDMHDPNTIIRLVRHGVISAVGILLGMFGLLFAVLGVFVAEDVRQTLPFLVLALIGLVLYLVWYRAWAGSAPER